MVDVIFSLEDFQGICAEIGMVGLDPSRWQNVLDKLRQISGGVRTQIFGFDERAELSLPALTSGYDPEFVDAFSSYYAGINPWAEAFFSAPSLTTLSANEMYPRDGLVRTEFWSDWVRPQDDLSYGGGTVLINTPHRKFILGGNIRSKDQDRMEASWLTLTRLIAPQIVNALDVSRILSGLRLESWLYRNKMDPTEAAVVVMDPAHRPVWANELARSWLEAGDPIRVGVSGKLSFRDPEMDLGATAARFAIEPKGAAIKDQAGHQVSLQLVQLGEEGLDLLPAPETLIVPTPLTVLLMRRMPETQDDAQRVSSALGLTRSEAEVALLLSQGLSPSEIAEVRDVMLVTVRNQIKSALSKTDSHRQTNLLLQVRRCLERPGRPSAPWRI